MGLYKGPQHKKIYTSEGLVSFGPMGLANITGKAEEEVLQAIKEGRLKGICPVEEEKGASPAPDTGGAKDATARGESPDGASGEKPDEKKSDGKKKGGKKGK